ncbi:MAG: hypothetical protein LW809_03285 [Vampirovibrionales bacterium]|jgi:hypothetical protein|nr:hypothetical protein [Vampirovibrionales bacterium]
MTTPKKSTKKGETKTPAKKKTVVRRGTDWVSIHPLYIQGISPSKLDLEYELPSGSVSRHAYQAGWYEEKKLYQLELAKALALEHSKVVSVAKGQALAFGIQVLNNYEAFDVKLVCAVFSKFIDLKDVADTAETFGIVGLPELDLGDTL